eukprot:2695307-Pyramimonas_sp.AAC.1
MDLNDGIGTGSKQGDGYIGEGVISEAHATREFKGGAGQQMRELLHRHHFAVFNDSLAPTWFGHSGEHSRLDYIFGP